MNRLFILEGRSAAAPKRAVPSITVPCRSQRLSRRRSYLLFGAILLLGTRSLSAGTYYWDLNGTAAGSGGPSPSGTWDTTTANWSTNPAGTIATVPFVNGNTADFSAGTDATGAYTVTVAGTIQTAGIVFEEGTVTLKGTSTPSLQIGTTGMTINSTVGGATTLDTTLGTVLLGGSQSWANNSASALVVNSAVSNSGNTAPYTLTLSGTGTGGTTITGNITNGGTTGTLALSITTTSEAVKITGSNGYTGGTTIGTSATLIAGSTSALGAAGAAVTISNGSILDLASDASTNAYNLTTSGASARTILSDRATPGSGLTQTLGTLLLGTAQLNIAAGTNVTGGSPVVAFGAVSLNNANGGAAVINPTTAGASLASVTNGANSTHSGSIVFDGTNANNIVTGAIANNGVGLPFAVTKSNSSIWAFTGANTYDGSTTISGGTLDLGGSTANGSITSTTSSEGLFLSGGTLKYTRTGGTTQSFFSTTISSGASAVNNTMSGDTVALNAITRTAGSGATVDFTPTGNISTTTANNSAGILGGYATVGGTDWAVSGTGSTAGNITALTSYTTLPTTTTTANTTNDILSATGTTTLGGTVSINSLKFNTTGTLALGANNLTFNGINGGLLVTANGGTISGSTGYVGSGTGNEFIVTTAASNTLTISSNIIGSGTAGGLTKTGTGTLVLSSANNYTGATFVNQGTLQANNTNTIQSSSLITINNAGTLALTANSALNTPSASTGVGTNVAGTTSTTQVPIKLTGGTLLRNGSSVSAGTGTTVGIGTLTLAPLNSSSLVTSTLDFGTTGVGTLNFNGFLDTNNAPLSVLDYARTSSLTSAGTDNTDDRLIFNEQLSAAQLADITFNGVAAQEFVLGNGEYEVTPLTSAVPEPATWLAGVLGLGSLGWSQRRRARAVVRRALRGGRAA